MRFYEFNKTDTDLESALTKMADELEKDQMAHVRAMSFVIPSEGAMQSIADDWRIETANAGGKIHMDPIVAAMEMPLDLNDIDEDDLDEDDMEFMEMTAEAMAMGSVQSCGRWRW